MKDASPSAADFVVLRWVHALFTRIRTNVPLLGNPPDIRCRRRACLQWRKPLHADGPTEAFVPMALREEHHLPGDQDAFHRSNTRRTAIREGLLLPPVLVIGLSLTPPTPRSRRNGVLLRALQSHGAITRESVTIPREPTPLVLGKAFRAWD